MLEKFALYVPLLQTLAWIALIVILVFLFRNEVKSVLIAIRKRIEKGSAFKAGPVELGPDLEHLDYADQSPKSGTGAASPGNWDAERTSIYQDNRGVFLAHVISPSKGPNQTKGPNQKYDVFIYLIRHKTTDFSDIEKAEFFFGHMWDSKVFEEREKAGRIGIRTAAYGTFLCFCKVHFNDGTVINLSRYIDFEMGRLFLLRPHLI